MEQDTWSTCDRSLNGAPAKQAQRGQATQTLHARANSPFALKTSQMFLFPTRDNIFSLSSKHIKFITAEAKDKKYYHQ